MGELSFVRRNTEAIVTGLVVTVIAAGAGYLAEKQSTLLHPFMDVIVAGSMALVSCIAVLIIRRIPHRRPIPNEKNIESCVRQWLDNHKLAVTKDPSDPTYFRYRIELPADKEKMTVLRMREEHPGYIQVLADLGIRGDTSILSLFSEQEINQLMFDIKLELARLRIGYSGLVIPPENFMLSKKVPISPSLTESEFMAAIFEVEAAMHIVVLMFIKARQNQAIAQPEPPLVSRTPALGA